MTKATRKGATAARLIATSVRFEPHIKAAIDKAANADGRTTSGLIQKIMTEWLKEKGLLK